MQHPHPFVTAPAQQSGTVAVVGLGKIGLPLAIQYIQHGRQVIGCDINPQVVEAINAGRCHVHEEPGLEDAVASAVAQGRLSATTDTASAARQAAVVVIIVPVIVNQGHAVDFRSIDIATQAVGSGLTSGTLVIYETTLPTGTTAGRLRTILEEQSGLKAGSDFLLAYSPERVSSGHISRDLATYPKVVGGVNEASRDAASAFYRSVLDAEVICMASTDEAEFVKLIETTYRDVNIALANEYARYADAHGLDAMAAISAANTQPYSHIHAPGVGVGGHCIPVYPYFLLSGATEGLALPRQARLINDGMADYAVERIETEIGSLAGQTVLILGVAYRGNVREVAFTSAKLLQQALVEHDARVLVEDPLFSEQELEALGYRPLRPEQRGEIHAIIVQAEHQVYHSLDFRQFPNCQLVLDGRRALKPEAITAAGMRYLSIGDGARPLITVR
ncbi:MAG TPA: nucleotide sugar dehydrogenase [Ktedonobacterales bacterium]|jgi:nucleotide sugar dehydrogenase